MTYIIQGSVIFPDRIMDAQIAVAGELCADVLVRPEDFTRPDRIIQSGLYIAPGFIDIQINGGFGREFKSHDDAVVHIAPQLLQHGTTGFCPTLTTSPLADYGPRIARLSAPCDIPGARVLGFHLEGPCFNAKKAG